MELMTLEQIDNITKEEREAEILRLQSKLKEMLTRTCSMCKSEYQLTTEQIIRGFNSLCPECNKTISEMRDIVKHNLEEVRKAIQDPNYVPKPIDMIETYDFTR